MTAYASIVSGVYPALSIRQPWAWFIVNGYKPFENRAWWTKFRGRLLIHASSRLDRLSVEEIIEYYQVEGLDPARVRLKLGGIVGVVDMVDCVNRSCSKWFHGPWGFEFKNPRRLPFSPCRGRLNIFDVNYKRDESFW